MERGSIYADKFMDGNVRFDRLDTTSTFLLSRNFAFSYLWTANFYDRSFYVIAMGNVPVLLTYTSE